MVPGPTCLSASITPMSTHSVGVGTEMSAGLAGFPPHADPRARARPVLAGFLPDQSGISTHVDGCQLVAGPAAEPDSVITASPSGSARNLSVMRPASVKSSAS
jgi:hypothetical protein